MQFLFRKCGWNEYQIKLENQISEIHNALNRKDEYIKNQYFSIVNLTQEKQVLNQRQLDEKENYKNQITKLSSIIADLKSKFAISEISYNREMAEMK